VENLVPRGLLGTPRRTMIAGVVALVLATILLLVYLSNYRSSVKSSSAPVTVLVAKRFIPKGMTANALAENGLFEVTSVSKDQLKDGAVTDPAVLRGEIAVNDVYPGQQLTTTDFGVTATASGLSSSPDLTGTWRAISISLDSTHGIMPQAQTGDRVDVYAQVGGVMGLLLENVLVLAAPNQAAANTAAPTSGNYIFRVPTGAAPRFAFAAQNESIWLVLRPQSKAGATRPAFVTDANIFGAK
jgi:Flp pilus assembly protein CpaB